MKTCRVCGCTETRACIPPCSWAEPDLCTSCQQVMAAIAKWAVRASDPNMLKLMIESAFIAGDERIKNKRRAWRSRWVKEISKRKGFHEN